jgi:hypothetical protein
MRAIPFEADLPTRRRMDVLRAALEDETRRINAVREVRGRTMSVLEKMKLVRERRVELTHALDAGAQHLLDKYDEAAKRKDEAFARHDAQLAAEMSELDELDRAISMLSNLGNSQGS